MAERIVLDITAVMLFSVESEVPGVPRASCNSVFFCDGQNVSN